MKTFNAHLRSAMVSFNNMTSGQQTNKRTTDFSIRAERGEREKTRPVQRGLWPVDLLAWHRLRA